MFTRIRWRLVGWTMLILVGLLLFLGTAVYTALARSLLEQVDRNLDSRGDQAAQNLEAIAAGERGDEREGYRGGVFFLVLAADGRVVRNPQGAHTAGAALPRLRGGEHVYATISLDGEPTRVYARPLGGRAGAGMTLVVGQSLAPERQALATLLFILVAGGGVGLLGSLAGAWFLAGRALLPIQQAFRRQQEFVADASHELRTPLTVLRSATDLLDQHRDEPLAANEELFDDVRHEIARMERLSGDLLTLARADRGELDLAVGIVDLASLAQDVVRRTAPLAQTRGVTVGHKVVDGSGVALVEGDPDRLEQVLLILLDNAIKHTPPGGRVDVTVQRQAHGVLLEVADTGAGIAPEHLPRIFNRFYRVDTARSRDRGGTGLGLAIARMLVEAHGGTVGAASAPGAGTRVRVQLPIASAAAQPGGRIGGLAARLGHAPGRE